MTDTAAVRADGLTGTLADIVCWMVFYLGRCDAHQTDGEVADELARMIASTLRRMAAADRLRFLEHAAIRAATSGVPAYQHFLLELAETLGLE